MNGIRSGGCTAHASKCGATQGIFIRLRRCEVVLLSESKRGKRKSEGKRPLYLALVHNRLLLGGSNEKLSMWPNFLSGLILPAPYVDDYGECDEGLHRGNPLRLDRDMYEDLQRTWTTNDIPDRISRAFDDEVLVIRAVWHQF